MPKYIIIHGQLREISDDELMHYGVAGMKWGVRRAQKQLSKATTKEDREKALSKLRDHKTKAAAKVEKLKKRMPELEKRAADAVMKTDVKAADLRRQSAMIRNRAYGTFVSRSRAEKRLYKANKLAARADALVAKSQQAKAKLESNKKMIETFNSGISEIDKTIVSSGKKYLS